LDNISGTFAGGSFTAIMGASGSGKTTLLNFLSGREYYLKGLRVEGEMLVNGNKRQDINFRELTAYVMQEDILIGSLTVRESLEFMA
jgi:ABC-type multidrug transport system ATPase subunit